MALISPSVLFLGLMVILVAAAQPSTTHTSNTTLKANSTVNTVTPFSITGNITTETPFNVTTSNSTVNPTVTKKDGGRTTKGGKGATTKLPTPKPDGPTKVPTTKDKGKGKGKSTPSPASASVNDNTGIIIIVVIIIIALIFAVACFFARKRGRRYSVDFTSRPDEANIPLSAVEPEMQIDAAPQNGLQTFESVETTKTESQEPEKKPEAQEEQKDDADKSEPSPESAAPAPSSDSSVDKPKEDDPNLPAPVELSVDEKTDDEGTVSTKTSVESLKETNENNSNNVDCSQMIDLMSSNNFQDVPLDCLV